MNREYHGLRERILARPGGAEALRQAERRRADDAYWAEIRAAMGKGTRSILWGTSNRSLDRSLARVRAASEEAQRDRSREGDDDVAGQGR